MQIGVVGKLTSTKVCLFLSFPVVGPNSSWACCIYNLIYLFIFLPILEQLFWIFPMKISLPKSPEYIFQKSQLCLTCHILFLCNISQNNIFSLQNWIAITSPSHSLSSFPPEEEGMGKKKRKYFNFGPGIRLAHCADSLEISWELSEAFGAKPLSNPLCRSTCKQPWHVEAKSAELQIYAIKVFYILDKLI